MRSNLQQKQKILNFLSGFHASTYRNRQSTPVNTFINTTANDNSDH